MFRGVQRRRVAFTTVGEAVTKQSFKKECDINNILSQFKRTGIITHIQSQQPVYADLPDDMDYQHSLAVLDAADAAFQTLPSVVRRFFDNDPAQLLQALQDPAMRPKLMELGIIKPLDDPRPAGNTEPPKTHINPAANPPSLDATS